MKKRVTIILCVFALALLVLFAPLPRHVTREYQGVCRRSGIDKPVTAKLDYWEFKFLLFEDRQTGKLAIETDGVTVNHELGYVILASGEGEPVLHRLAFFWNNAAEDSVLLAGGVGDAELNRLIIAPNSLSQIYILGAGEITTEEVLEVLEEPFELYQGKKR